MRKDQTPAERRAIELRLARSLVREARIRREGGYLHMAATMLVWAGNARRRAAAIDVSPDQGSLFDASTQSAAA